MQCPQCLSHNHNAAGFCDQCGARLRVGNNRGGGGASSRAPLVVGVLVVLLIAGGFGWFALSRSDEGTPSPDTAGRSEQPDAVGSDDGVEAPFGNGNGLAVDDEAEPLDDDGTEATAATVRLDGPEREDRVLQVATVSLVDPWENEVAAVPAAVVAGSWIVLPREVCLGGKVWQATLRGGSQFDITRGYWRTSDGVGLWRLDAREDIPGPELHPWSSAEKLSWLPFSGASVDELRVGFLKRHGEFSAYESTQAVARPGVVVQGNAVVGWTFGGKQAGKVWLWEGSYGEDLTTGTRVEDFYQLTFAGGREEMFGQAISEKTGLQPLDRLHAFANGCRVLPRLLFDETPEIYRMKNVLVRMKQLLSPILHGGDDQALASVVRSFDDRVLTEAGDPQLLVVMATAIAESIGPGAAIDSLQRVGSQIVQTSADERLTIALELKLYQQWVQELVVAENVAQGWTILSEAQEAFPDDPELHLRGVELYLFDLNWRDAEARLHARTYPARFSDQVKLLQAEISKLKGQEGKIVIKFPPGSKSIRTVAQLNGQLDQQFIVDTGASSTLVPASAIRKMGLRVGTRRVEVRTANGKVVVPVMRIDSIVIGGYPVRDVEVLVMDMPGQSDMGLLGLTTLNAFRMDLRLDEGILTLEPR